MSWVSKLQPDLILGGSILELTPDILQQYQLSGLVLDVDQTLIPVTKSRVSGEIERWVEQTRAMVSLWLVSNNLSENRISRIASSLDLPYIYGARKPSRRKLKIAVDAMNLPIDQVAMVGDRLFTDVLAGNRLGMFTILVEPIRDPAMSKSLYPMRDLEVWFSQALGVSLTTMQQNFNKPDKSQ
ncbi:MAG: YqeG family HAD IIIA-type phosphatase [Moorea sp. SIO3C2]|nr:YqeG family HAD IIIA-type phosphatase [Moorena sp. SIO3C2]